MSRAGVLPPFAAAGPIKSDFSVDNYCATDGLGVLYCQVVLWTNHLRLGLFSAGQQQRQRHLIVTYNGNGV